jgi:hypothetical protein
MMGHGTRDKTKRRELVMTSGLSVNKSTCIMNQLEVFKPQVDQCD